MSPDESISTSRNTDRFTALCELAQEMALVEDERTIYRVVLEVARKVLDFFNCAILLIDPEGKDLVLTDQHGYPDETLGMRLPLKGAKGLSCWVAEHGEMLYVPDESDRVDAFDRDEAMLLQALASQLAVALELNRARAELDRQSITDMLTGVYNRRYLERLLPSESSRAERFQRPIALLMLDLDDFKLINDRFGHQQGDQVLVAFADALVNTVRKIDSVIRYGGDEFLVVMTETDDEGGRRACQRIREGVMAALRASPAVPAGVQLGVSVGLSVRQPGEDVVQKLSEADRAMYADKQA